MTTIGNLICLTPAESYLIDEPLKKKGVLGRLESWTGPFVRNVGMAYPYLVGFLRKHKILDDDTRIVMQHDKIEGTTPFEEILRNKVDLGLGDHDVLFITAFTNSVREAYRRAREARTAYAAHKKNLTVVLGGAHASAVPDEATRMGYVDTVVQGEGEWAAAELLTDIREGRPVRPLYKVPFQRIRDCGVLAIDMGIWEGLDPKPQKIPASTTFARGCKLNCHFCAVFLTSGPAVRNRDLSDIVHEIESQGQKFTSETIDQIGPGFYNNILRALVKMPVIGSCYGDRLIANMGPGYTNQYFFWDDNLYNAAGSCKALFEAIMPIGRPWLAQMTMDFTDHPDLLKLAYASGCREIFLGFESIDQKAVDGLNKWSNETKTLKEKVKKVHDAGINIMGAFVFGLDGDDSSVFDRTLEFLYETKIDSVVANIIQPYPGTRTFYEAVRGNDLLPCASCPPDSDISMDYNWPLFDGAHVLIRPRGMTVDQLQDGYYYFLQEAYSLSGIGRRSRARWYDIGQAFTHFARNHLISRYALTKTAHALRRKKTTFI